MLRRIATSSRILGSLFAAFALAFLRPAAVDAKVYHLSPEKDWFSVLQGDQLKPGDEVVLAEGVYRDARKLWIGHRGNARQPIVIRAADQARAVFHRPDARQNSMNVEGVQYLVLRGLEITGGSTGIRLGGKGNYACKFVTIEQLHIHHVGGPAITANYPGHTYEGLVFRRNHIHHTGGHGEGFYLGVNNKSDGSTNGTMFDSLIEGNYIHDLTGSHVSQGDGIEIKDGSYNNIVRDNVIHNTNYPGVIVYGTDGKAPNIIERNVIWGSGDHGIQAAAEAIIRNNIIFDNRADGIYNRAHQSAEVGNLRIVHNTVISSRSGAAALRALLSGQQRFHGKVVVANNAFYAAPGGHALRLPRAEVERKTIILAGNVGAGAIEGLPPNMTRHAWIPGGQLERDLDEHKYPTAGSLLLGAADARFLVADDFNRTPRRDRRDVGAYVHDRRGNPGWRLAPGFKN